MAGVRDGVDVGELACRLADGAEILGPFQPGDELILPDEHHVDEADHRRRQERQLIGAVGAGGRKIHTFLPGGGHAGGQEAIRQDLQHPVVREGAGGIQQAVGHRQGQGQEALGVLVVAVLLPLGPELRVLGGVHHAEADGAGADQQDGAEGQGRIVVPAHKEQRQNRHESPGGIADGGGDGELDVPQAQVPQGHGADVEQGHGEIRPDHGPADGGAADENFKRGVEAHHRAHGDDHFQVGELVVRVPAADLGEEVAAAPAEQRNEGEPKPHGGSSS